MSAQGTPGRARRGLSLRHRIFLATMAVIAGLLALTYVVMAGLVARILEEEIEDGLGRARAAQASFREARQAGLLDQARSVAQVPHLRAVLDTPGVDEATLRYTVESLGDALGALLLVADARGAVLAHTWGARGAPDVLPALAGGPTGESSGVCEHGGDALLLAVSPVVRDGVVLGRVGVAIPLVQHARDLRAATGRDVAFLRGARVLAAAWDDEAGPVECGVATDPAAWSAAEPWRDARIASGGREYMATAVPLDDAGLRLVLSSPLDDVLRHFDRARAELAAVGLLIAALGLVVSRWISDRIAQPIRELTSAARELARGDLSAAVDVRSGDEIGTLAGAFNEMARRLAALMTKATEEARAAEQASRAKSAFLATVSHEIRTPLHGVLGFAEELRHGELTERQRECVAFIERSGQDLLAIIEEILEFARLERGEARLDESEFRVASCIARALDPLRPALAAKGLALAVEVDAGVPETLVGPAGRIRQIVASYAANALKFTAHGGLTVRAGVAADDERGLFLRISVSDTGIGIVPADLQRLFRPFTQLDSDADREYGGTGLGLAICKELAGLMHGEVGVESVPGAGSTFWFTARLRRPPPVTGPATARDAARDVALAAVPAALPAPVETVATAAPSGDERARRARFRVLVAEDNRVNQRVVAAVLERAGLRHAVAENGARALELFAGSGFDLVLMDCQMPVLDGLEATRRLRALPGGRTVPIIALTANAFPSDRAACLAAGMDDLVAKPFSGAELIARVDRWLAERAAA